MASQDSFGARSTLTVGDRSYEVFRLDKVEGAADLPYSLKVLLENLLRTEDGANITADHVRALAGWDPSAGTGSAPCCARTPGPRCDRRSPACRTGRR